MAEVSPPCGAAAPTRRLTPEQQTLAAPYFALALSLAKPLKDRFPSAAHDFESDACLALTEAAASFPPDGHLKFASYARRKIEWRLKQSLRDLAPLGYRGEDPGAPAVVQLRHEAGARTNDLERVDAVDLVDRLLKTLPDKLSPAVGRVYLEGHSHSAAAKVLGVSKSMVQLLCHEAIDLLKVAPPALAAAV